MEKQYRLENFNIIKYKDQLFFKTDTGRYRARFGKYKGKYIENVVFEEKHHCSILKGIQVDFRDGDYGNPVVENLFLTGRWKTRPSITTHGKQFYLYYHGEVVAKSMFREDLEKLSIMIDGKKITDVRSFVKKTTREQNGGRVYVLE